MNGGYRIYGAKTFQIMDFSASDEDYSTNDAVKYFIDC